MILKKAVKYYLSRPLESHAWIKKLSRRELWEALRELRPVPDFGKDIFKHQLACFLLGLSYHQFCFWLDMGTGKTRLTLELLRYFWRAKEIKRAVIFITSDKAYPTWSKQIKRFEIGLPHLLLSGSSTNKWRALEEFGSGLIFISYPGAVRMMTTRVKKKKKVRWVMDKAKVAQFTTDVGALVMDESTRASGRDSLTHRIIKRMGKTVPIRYALAGRPFGRDPTLLFTQHLLVDGGETLGDTLGMFREAFFTSRKHPFSRNPWIKKWTFDKTNKQQLARMIQHRSITYSEQECIDVPKWVSIRETVQFPVEAQEYYDQAVQSIIKAKGNYSAVKNLFLRMRQLSSGFVGFKNDETGERAQVEFEDNPKFDRLMELLEELPTDRKAVVFYDFTFSGRKIATAAKELDLRPVWIWSGTKDYARDLDRFENDPRYRLCVLQNRVGAMALDGLQVANYCMVYESPVGCIDREQMERRLRRQGQKRKVFQYDFVVRGSVDDKILKYHKEGGDLHKALLRDPQGVLDG